MNQFQNESMEVLMERAKELECLYLIDEALAGTSLPDILLEICDVIPLGFRDIQACTVTIDLEGQHYSSKPTVDNGDEIQSEIIVESETRGYIKAMYPKDTFPEDEEVFLDQETRLLNTIANRISESIYKKNLQNVNDYKRNWKAIIKLLQKTNHDMLLYLTVKSSLVTLGQIFIEF